MKTNAPKNGGRRALLAVGAAIAAARFARAEGTTSVGPPSADTALSDTGLGKKFAPNGQVQRWPGCTLISHIPRPGLAFEALCTVRDLMRSTPAIRSKLSWLPEQSYHMTICDLLNVAHSGQADSWPAGVSLDAPLSVACEHVAAELRDFDLGFAPPLRLRLDPVLMSAPFLSEGRLRTAVPWLPFDELEARRLSELRARVFDATGLHHPGDHDYAFHTTLAYPVEQFSEAEAADYAERFTRGMRYLHARVPVLALEAPEFCLYESMFFFEPQFRLRRRSV